MDDRMTKYCSELRVCSWLRIRRSATCAFRTLLTTILIVIMFRHVLFGVVISDGAMIPGV